MRPRALFQQPLMHERRDQPHAEAQAQDAWKRELLFKTDKGRQEKQGARQHAPESAPGEVLHEDGIAPVLKIQPHQGERARERHDGDQPGCYGQFFPERRYRKDNNYDQGCLDNKLHHVFFLESAGWFAMPDYKQRLLRQSCLQHTFYRIGTCHDSLFLKSIACRKYSTINQNKPPAARRTTCLPIAGPLVFPLPYT